MDKTKLLLCFKNIYYTFIQNCSRYIQMQPTFSFKPEDSDGDRESHGPYVFACLTSLRPPHGQRSSEVPQPINQKIAMNPFPRAVCTTINSLCLQIMPTFSWYRNRLADVERMKGKLDYDHDVGVSEFRHV
jgi:hypothetical protein